MGMTPSKAKPGFGGLFVLLVFGPAFLGMGACVGVGVFILAVATALKVAGWGG
jgi:hypothetical protein